MKTITSAAELKIAIKQLELEHSIKGEVLKEQFFVTIESLTPANIIKRSLNDIATSPFLVDNIIGSAVGLITGYLSKIITVGSTKNPFKKLLGNVLQFAVTNIIAQHPEVFKTVGEFFMNHMFKREEINREKTC
jgi:hypothetical protein